VETTIRCLRISLAVLLVAAAIGCVVAGCSGANSLDGTKWKLTGWTVSSIDPVSVNITATFDDAQISGSSGVNRYGGPVKTGRGGSFAAGPLAATEMAGSELEMRAESAYLTLLSQARSCEVTDTTLTLHDGGGNESLIFSRVAR
jgi:heat shock protein HslJ